MQIETRYSGKLDIQNNNEWEQKARLAIVKGLPHTPVTIGAAIEREFFGSKKIQVNLTVTWFL